MTPTSHSHPATLRDRTASVAQVLFNAMSAVFLFGCASLPPNRDVKAAPIPVNVELPTTERLDHHRRADTLQPESRPELTIDETLAIGRTALQRGSPGDIQFAANALGPITATTRRLHKESLARIARAQLALGLAANNAGCLRNGIANMAAAKPEIRGLFEHEQFLVMAAHARLGLPRPDTAATRLGQAMRLYTNRRLPAFVEEIKFLDARGGDTSKLQATERQIQSALFELLRRWVLGQPTDAALSDLLWVASLAEFQGFRLLLNTEATSVDAFATATLSYIFQELQQTI